MTPQANLPTAPRRNLRAAITAAWAAEHRQALRLEALAAHPLAVRLEAACGEACFLSAAQCFRTRAGLLLAHLLNRHGSRLVYPVESELPVGDLRAGVLDAARFTRHQVARYQSMAALALDAQDLWVHITMEMLVDNCISHALQLLRLVDEVPS